MQYINAFITCVTFPQLCVTVKILVSGGIKTSVEFKNLTIFLNESRSCKFDFRMAMLLSLFLIRGEAKFSLFNNQGDKKAGKGMLLTDKNKLDNDEISINAKKEKIIGKPLNTMTPKPSFTKFSKHVADNVDGDLPMAFPKDDDSLKEEIKKQLVSTPMIVFYGVLSGCVVIACGIFMFCTENEEDDGKEEEQQQAALEEQLNETLDPQLNNEAPLQL